MSRAPGSGRAAQRPLPWRRGLAWLLFLGPFFFASYGFANWASLQRATTAVIVFPWERAIPFLPWTIVPYWSIDLLYALSFLACRDSRAVDRHGLRLLTVQLVAIGCFLAFPMRFSFERPATDGAFAVMFAALASFDQPFNQAPSLHVALLVVLWSRFAPLFRGWRGALAHGWFALIGVSVLTTWQHHFVDVPTGALLGLAAMWLWPEAGRPPLAGMRLATDRDRRRLAIRYGLGAAALGGIALTAAGAWLWLFWPAISLALVALAYGFIGAAAFQKRGRSHSFASTWLFAPYTIGAWINARLWTRHCPGPDAIADGVWIGRIPSGREIEGRGFATVVDLCAELPAANGSSRHHGLPWLDLVAPGARDLRAAAATIEAARREGNVLVCCALGYGRSACAVAAWLIVTGRARSAADALALVRRHRPGVSTGAAHGEALAAVAATL